MAHHESTVTLDQASDVYLDILSPLYNVTPNIICKEPLVIQSSAILKKHAASLTPFSKTITNKQLIILSSDVDGKDINDLSAPSFSKCKSQLHSEFDQISIPQLLQPLKKYLTISVKRMLEEPKENPTTATSCPNPVAFKITKNGDCQITKAVLQTTTNQLRNLLKSFHLNGIDWYDAFLEITEVHELGINFSYNVRFATIPVEIQTIISHKIILSGCDIMFPGTFSPTIISINGFIEASLINKLQIKQFQDSKISESIEILLARAEKVKTKKGFRNKISHFEFDINCNMEYNFVRFISNDGFNDHDFIYKLKCYIYSDQKVIHGVKVVDKKQFPKQRTRKGNAKKRSKSKTTLEREAALKLKQEVSTDNKDYNNVIFINEEEEYLNAHTVCSFLNDGGYSSLIK